ncbi:glycosyltransferase family protein [Microbacterium murale]|uniref:Spore protein YkvP/CgeB glycosyl transferase-like domain-containing protein n=1 Tax=Microbacterium murale TaxID=1081040 RepID=A0ABU0PCJ3_9MICO|nr:glycosyltransferase [Microbacterium murale]MDQ0645040.1 hypothetical protein [Microbacterium murale]
MGSVIARALRWMIRHRNRIPLLGGFIASAENDPRGLASRIVYHSLGADRSRPSTTSTPTGTIRVIVGPTNYAGQGNLWALAMAEHVPDLGARSLSVATPGAIAFEADTTVALPVYRHSHRWQDAEYAAVVDGFTHVLMESMRPLFGLRFDDVTAEIAALREHGLSVALIAHGTDVRSPTRHASAHRWSPFAGSSSSRTLEATAELNRHIAETLGLPLFVSTLDLLDDLPDAAWCPVVIDPHRWRSSSPPLSDNAVPVVVHTASSAHVKGSALIEPALRRLHADGRIVYRPLTGVPSERMPDELRRADIVLDQFRLGSYGVAACEAMAAGRIVIGHVSHTVRERVTEETSLELPMIESSPDEIAEVLLRVLDDPDGARKTADRGVQFVDQVHSGAASATALLDGWLAHSKPAGG